METYGDRIRYVVRHFPLVSMHPHAVKATEAAEDGRLGAFHDVIMRGVLPGVSRSGSTIAAAMWFELDPERAAEYSFLLPIPAILAAALLQLPDFTLDDGAVGTGPLWVGFASSLVSGIFAIRVLVALLRQGRFHRFAPY